MAKQAFYKDDARERVLKGAEALYKAVSVTMGPKGGNVVIERQFGNQTVTHDGVTVARSVDIPQDESSRGYRVGAELIKEAANKMNDTVGDGTTTVTVLTYHILKEAHRLIAAGHNPMELREQLEESAKEVLKALENETIAIEDKMLKEVANISAGDREIGELVASVISKVGKDGAVTVEEGQTLALESEITEGFTFERGFVSPYMVTDSTRMEAVYDNPAIILTDRPANSIQELAPLLDKLIENGRRNILFIAPSFDGDALPNLVLNKVKGTLNTVAVKAPSFGENQKLVLQDLAILTGGYLISADTDLTFANAQLNVVGTARKVIVSQNATTIIGGGGSKEDLATRIDALKSQANTADETNKQRLTKRIAALSGKVAVIRVGGVTETEIEEKKYRVDDAVAAAKAALAEGIVPGGGTTLLQIARSLKTDTTGSQILVKALEQPFRILMDNAGYTADKYLDDLKKGWGVNVRNGEKVDLLKNGIVDPVAVTKKAVQNAVSLAGTAITMGALLVEIPEKEESNENY